MHFDPVDPKQSLPDLERGILKYWKEEDIFKRSLHMRGHETDDPLGASTIQGKQNFSFYDGPPFATGLPHYGHLLAGTIKDVIPRYQSMRGKFVQRRFGWDCHGLPVEYEIEKEKGLKSRRDIEAMGVEAFNTLCRGAVQRFTKEWRVTVERMGRWVDMDWDYRTMDPDFMESIWWVFSKLHEKKLLYEGHKPMHICPRCATPLSNFEVTQGYKDRDDQSVIITFPLVDDPNTLLLAWTTTPWSLPGNFWLAVGPQIEYVKVRHEGKTYILAKKLVESVFKGKEYSVEGDIAPDALVGKQYKPLWPYFTNVIIPSTKNAKTPETYGQRVFKVITNEAIAVSDEEGTGIVHLTSSTGEDSNAAARAEGVDVLPHVAIDGSFIPAVTDFVGLNAKPEGKDPQSTDKIVIENLKRNGRAFSWFTITHSYPHCWRCDTPLLPYTTNSWFVAVEKIKSAMLKANAKTRWVPAHLRDGRFGKWIENARDWAISRNRYWGTPLPVWKCAATGEVEVIGSRDELMAKIPKRFTKVTVIRHAQSVGNTLPIYQSALPGTDLTEKGRAQAAAAAAFLKSRVASRESPVAKTIIYTSPLARAEQTAAVIADALTAKVITDERLREVSFGDYEGKKVDFSDLKFVRERRAHKIESGKVESVYHFPGMETWDSVQERIEAFLREALPNHRGEHVVLVTHADVVVNLKHFFTKEDPVKLSHQPYPGFAEPESYFWDHESGSALDLHKHVVDDLRWETTKSKVLPTTLTVVYHDDATNARKLVETLNASDHDAIVTLSSGEAKKAGDMLAASWKKDLHAMKASEGASGPAIREAIADMLRHFSGKRVLLLAPTSWTNFIHAFGHADAAWKPDDSTTAETYLLQPLFERVPEVLDCWFESGSMPYAQEHFPFNPNSQFPAPNSPRGFPADFIAEGIDQTRGWFYTLTVLSTALFKKPAFLNCIVNGTVLAEDGKKMSKRLKNYPEPLAVVEKHGADAVRFALMKSPAVRAEDMRFSEKLVEETVRSVLLPLWNTYSFLVTYANLANVEIQPTPTASKHPLDQWILAEMQDLVNRMSAQLDAYDLSKACAELEGTIDALTNWYVRLSRRRFAGKGEGGVNDQKAALETLHSVLLTLTQTLAPFCPFITEAIYLNLVPIEHGSIHFTDWPAVRKLKKAEQLLLSRTRLLRSIVSLGMKVRAEHTIKLRQPLKAAFVAIPAVLRDVVRLETDEEHLLREELNVKELTFVDDPSTLAEVFVQVDARKVGPRLGGKVQELIKAGKLGEFTENDDGTLTILGERLNADEAAIQYRGKEGRNIASSHGIVVALDATVSDELKQEGVARDLVRAIQKLRKDAGLKITDKIALEVNGADALMDLHGTVICAETNAVLKSAKGETHEIDLDGEKVTIRFAAL